MLANADEKNIPMTKHSDNAIPAIQPNTAVTICHILDRGGPENRFTIRMMMAGMMYSTIDIPSNLVSAFKILEPIRICKNSIADTNPPKFAEVDKYHKYRENRV